MGQESLCFAPHSSGAPSLYISELEPEDLVQDLLGDWFRNLRLLLPRACSGLSKSTRLQVLGLLVDLFRG